MESDSGLSVSRVDEGSVSRFTLTTWRDEVFTILARLAPGGPVVDHAVARGLAMGRMEDTLDVVQVLSDGTQVIEVTLHAGFVPDDLNVQVNIFVGGVTFVDGTLTQSLTAADFSELGEVTVYMLRGPSVTTSVCHRVEVYQDGEYLGQL